MVTKGKRSQDRFVGDQNDLFRRSKVFQTRSGDRKGPKGPRGVWFGVRIGYVKN